MTQQHRWILGGGLASGKSVVRSFLARSGIATIDADRVGHSVLETDGPAFAAVAERWPQVVVDGTIDRKTLAGIVFANPAELAVLEGITHPYIFDTIRGQVEGIGGPVVVEMPLIGDALGPEWRRLVVDSRDDLKISRAVARGMEEDDALARLAAQPNREQWLTSADLVIPNHGTISDLEGCVERTIPHV